MTTFMKVKLKKSFDQMNIAVNRVAANITEYHIISKLIFLRIITWTYKLFGQNYRVTTLSHIQVAWMHFFLKYQKQVKDICMLGSYLFNKIAVGFNNSL